MMPFRSGSLLLLVACVTIIGYTSVGFLIGRALGDATTGMISAAVSLLVGVVLLVLHHFSTKDKDTPND